jgi:leader peptidase (prepilin peptidase) / N-methyltransferase
MKSITTGTAKLLALAPALIVVVASFLLLPPALAVASCVLGLAMLAVVFTDFKWFIVPDAISLPAIPIGLFVSGRFLDPSSDALVNSDHVIGMIAGGFSFWLLRALYFAYRRNEGLGLGDVKLAAVAGAWVGWQAISHVLLLASILALSAILMSGWRGERRISATDKLPFGCFLAPSIWAVWFLQVYGRSA